MARMACQIYIAIIGWAGESAVAANPIQESMQFHELPLVTRTHIHNLPHQTGWLADLQSGNLSAGAAKATFALLHHSLDEVLQIALGSKVWSCVR
jgi:hypothetical protein